MKCPKCGSEMTEGKWSDMESESWFCFKCGHEEPVKEGKA